MSSHEELQNLAERIEGLERRHAFMLGIVTECARQLTEVVADAQRIDAELQRVRGAAMSMLKRAIDQN